MQRISYILDMYEKHSKEKTVKIHNKMYLLKVYINGKYDSERVGEYNYTPHICMRYKISQSL